MTTQEKLIRNKMILLDLAEYLKNVSEACKINGISRQHFYDIKKAYEDEGLEGLREKSRRKPCMKNRVAPEMEEAVIRMTYEYPAYGQTRASNELKKSGVLISSGGVRSIWRRRKLVQKRRWLFLWVKGVIHSPAAAAHHAQGGRRAVGNRHRWPVILERDIFSGSAGFFPMLADHFRC